MSRLQFERYRKFLTEYVQFIEELAKGESEQYAALISYDHKRIDRAVSSQQAMNMRLSKMELQRELEQEKAGFSGLSLQQILERAQGTEEQAYAALLKRLEQAIDQLRYYNGKCVSFAQDGLQILGVEGALPAAPYGSDGRRPDAAQGTSLFETKI